MKTFQQFVFVFLSGILIFLTVSCSLWKTLEFLEDEREINDELYGWKLNFKLFEFKDVKRSIERIKNSNHSYHLSVNAEFPIKDVFPKDDLVLDSVGILFDDERDKITHVLNYQRYSDLSTDEKIMKFFIFEGAKTYIPPEYDTLYLEYFISIYHAPDQIKSSHYIRDRLIRHMEGFSKEDLSQ